MCVSEAPNFGIRYQLSNDADVWDLKGANVIAETNARRRADREFFQAGGQGRGQTGGSALLRMVAHGQHDPSSLAKGIRQVAIATGFDNEKSFSRAFRRWTGHSPRSYRSEHKPTAGAVSG